jgi:hypothetical protein
MMLRMCDGEIRERVGEWLHLHCTTRAFYSVAFASALYCVCAIFLACKLQFASPPKEGRRNIPF